MVDKCDAITKAGKPCRARPQSGKRWCLAHDPDLTEKRREANRIGGAARSNARRAAKQWAAIGREIGDDDLSAILKSCMVAVRDGKMEPGQANAIAQLARTSMQITGDLKYGDRVAELERIAGISTRPTPIRRSS